MNAICPQKRVHVCEVVENKIAARFDLGRSGLGVARYSRVGVVGINVNPIEIGIWEFRKNLMRHAVMHLYTGVIGDALIKEGEIKIDEMQFIGLARSKDVPREMPPFGTEFRDAAPSGELLHEFVPGRTHFAVREQACGYPGRRLALGNEMAPKPERMSDATWKPLAEGEIKASEDAHGGPWQSRWSFRERVHTKQVRVQPDPFHD